MTETQRIASERELAARRTRALRRKHKKEGRVFSRELVINQVYRHKATGQLFRVLVIGEGYEYVEYRAESNYTGRGCALAPKVGEVRRVTNVAQWAGNVRLWQGDAA